MRWMMLSRWTCAAPAVCASLVAAGAAHARPYTVVSCDSASLFGYSGAGHPGAMRECRQHIRDVPVRRRPVRGHKRPAHRSDLPRVRLLGPRLQRTRPERASAASSGPAGWRATTAPEGTYSTSRAERSRGGRTAAQPVLRESRLGHAGLAVPLRRPDRDNPGSNNSSCAERPRMLPRRRDAHAQRRGDDRGPDRHRRSAGAARW